MPRSAAPFKKSDIERAVSGARAAGLDIARLEIDPKSGRIIIIAGGAAAELNANELDSELAAFEERHESQN